jgi:hypothetical protein
MKRTAIVFTLLFISLLNFAQQKSISELMDDGGRSTSKDIIKTDLSEFLKANIPIIWEHRFNDNLGFQAGVGLLTNGFFQPVIRPGNTFDDYTYNEQLKNGFSLQLTPMFFYDGFESTRFGFPFKYHSFPGQVVSYEVDVAFGKQWFLTRNIAVSVDLALGLNYEKTLDGKSFIFDNSITNADIFGGEGLRLVFPLSVKIGYVL